ncbi:MAG: hypothetical protein JWM80_2557 [Cyanobacteria bacterium RYN_339]|nr:hypothetical protein [Cyanobacteria bacterium RYN_339]
MLERHCRGMFVLSCLRKYNYQVELDGDRVIFWYKGDTTAKVPLANLARVRLAPKGRQTMFVERDGTKYYTTGPVAPEFLRALDANGVAIEGRPPVG